MLLGAYPVKLEQLSWLFSDLVWPVTLSVVTAALYYIENPAERAAVVDMVTTRSGRSIDTS